MSPAGGPDAAELGPVSSARVAAETARRVLGDYAEHLAVHPPLTAEEVRAAEWFVTHEGSGILAWVVRQCRAAVQSGTMPAGRTPSENYAVRIVRERFGEHYVERAPR